MKRLNSKNKDTRRQRQAKAWWWKHCFGVNQHNSFMAAYNATRVRLF